MIASAKHGRTVTHTVQLDALGVVEDWIANRRLFWTKQLDALAPALEDRT